MRQQSPSTIFELYMQNDAPHASAQIVPVISSVTLPGTVVHTPVVGSCVTVAAGTVIVPAVVRNTPVVSL